MLEKNLNVKLCPCPYLLHLHPELLDLLDDDLQVPHLRGEVSNTPGQRHHVRLQPLEPLVVSLIGGVGIRADSHLHVRCKFQANILELGLDNSVCLKYSLGILRCTLKNSLATVHKTPPSHVVAQLKLN